MPIAFLDVQYTDPSAAAAAVVLAEWTDAVALEERVVRVPQVAPYVPGAFFERELPCLLAVLGQVQAPLQAVVVDGYVWLDATRPGLGAHLAAHFRERGTPCPVVGVAKTRFGPPAAPSPSPHAAVEVLRGTSRRPLFVTADGLAATQAAQRVAAMHGADRIPWALSRVDRLCREAAHPQAVACIQPGEVDA